MLKFGLIKDKGIWNKPSTNIYYGHFFNGYKPLQSVDIFGLINSTDGNFWLLSENDDSYWTIAKISEETIRHLHNILKNEDFSDSEMFSFENTILTICLNNLTILETPTIQINKKEVNIKKLKKLIRIEKYILKNDKKNC